jgi:hypothetical protein
MIVRRASLEDSAYTVDVAAAASDRVVDAERIGEGGASEEQRGDYRQCFSHFVIPSE